MALADVKDSDSSADSDSGEIVLASDSIDMESSNESVISLSGVFDRTSRSFSQTGFIFEVHKLQKKNSFATFCGSPKSTPVAYRAQK